MAAERTNEEARRFAPPPGYTQIPNVLLDEVMPQITTLAELKVTVAIARETFGWQREERLLDLDDLQRLTKLSRQSAQNGVTAALARGFVGRRRKGHGFAYGLRVKNVGSEASNEESRSLTELSLDSGLPSSKGKKTLRGKQKQKGAGAPSPAKKADDGLGKPGQPFQPEEGNESHQVIVELFEVWRTRTPQPDGTVLTNKRAGQIRARMREQAEDADRDEALAVARERMLEGLEGWIASAWHQERGAYDFETFFRSRGKVDAFRGRYHRSQAAAATNGAGGDYSGYKAVIEHG